MPDRPALHPAARMHAAEVARGQLGRREFLTRATALGVSIPAAYALLGATAPRAATQERRPGGTLRIQQDVRALRDPRTFDWPQLSNYTRGWLEYLVEYTRDGSFQPMLLEAWEVDDDAQGYTLRVRPGVTWNDGSPFTARDVAWNFTRWCDRSVEGNSMASRLPGLVDPDTGRARDGAIEVVDDLTLRLTLSEPDISIIATCSDYTAAIVKDGDEGRDLLANPVGTGPFLPGEYEVGVRGELIRNDDHAWWGTEIFGAPSLDRILFIDLGTDQSAIIAAVDAGEIDMTYETVGDFIDMLDPLMVRDEAVTARTLVIRPNQNAEVDGIRPYADVRVRRALAMAVDNEVLLELGYNDRGVVAENHHVAPIHPEYAELPEPPVFDPEGARALMEEAGMGEFVHELISIDDSWRRPTADAAAAMLRDAGIPVERTVLPGATFWNDWQNYPFSTTDWGHRPLGVQSLALAYRSGEPWNESGFENEEFDALIAEALRLADADERREVMARIQKLMQDEGVVIQPYWTSVFRHHAPGVVGAEAHPAFEIYPYKLGFAA